MVSEWIPALITGGLGAALGSIGTALVQSLSGRGLSRAEAADKVANAAGSLADRLDKMNANLSKENAGLRRAVLALTDIIEEVTPLLPDPMIRQRAHDAITTARLALR